MFDYIGLFLSALMLLFGLILFFCQNSFNYFKNIFKKHCKNNFYFRIGTILCLLVHNRIKMKERAGGV